MLAVRKIYPCIVNNVMEFLSAHLIECLVAAEIAITVWLVREAHEAKKERALMKLEVSHINKSVNNADAGEKTLRELVKDNNEQIADVKAHVKVLDDRTKRRYTD